MNYKIENGDCLELMAGIPDKSVDMILTDLPYGTTSCEWDIIIPFEKLWPQYNRVIKENGAIILFASQPFTTQLIASNMKNFKYCWYWKKNNITGALNARKRPMCCIEDICVFYKKQPTYNPQGLQPMENAKFCKPKKDGVYNAAENKNGSLQLFTEYPNHLLEFNKDIEKYHPTQKPVALLQYLIRTYTNEGETVLDSTMGSGSTGVACMVENRKFIGFEKEKKYFSIAADRIANASMKLF